MFTRATFVSSAVRRRLRVRWSTSARLAAIVARSPIQIGVIHTYLGLFGRYLVDLTPRVSSVCAQSRTPPAICSLDRILGDPSDRGGGRIQERHRSTRSSALYRVSRSPGRISSSGAR